MGTSMRFLIHCMNPRTGQPHEFELDAHDRLEAEKLVQAARLIPGRIEPAGDRAGPGTPTEHHPTAAQRETARNRRRIRFLARIIGAAGIVVIVVAVLGTILSGREPSFSFREIRASVRFDGTRFSIANMDDFPWHNVVIDLNGGLANRGCALRPGDIDARHAIAVPATDFVDDSGRHYDPAIEPLRQLRIICDVGDGEKALYTRRWDPPLGIVSSAP